MKKIKPIRILHVVGAMNRAGTETMLMNIYRNIDREKVQFDFISYSQEEAHYDKEIKELGGKVIKLSSTTSVKELVNAINENGPYEVVHAHTLFNSGIAMLAAKKCGIKTRISHAHTTLDNNSSIVRKIYANGMRLLINKYSTKTLACSREAGKYLFGENEINKSKYSYFPNLINYEELLHKPEREVAKFKEEYNLNDGILIGHIGTLKESKNHKFLIEIAKYMTEQNIDVKLLLVGDGSLRKELEDLTREYNISDRVHILGIREDIDVILHSMDVFVFPSIFEGLGLVLLEAQAAGLPCIVSEAIQPEADLGLNLFTNLKLDDGVEIWAKHIMKSINKKEISLDKVSRAFEEKEYSKDRCISKLIKIYNIKSNELTSLN